MTLHGKALQIRAAREEQELKKKQERMTVIKEHLEIVKQGFCACFARYLPFLEQHRIKWSAHLNKPNYIPSGSYIEFEMDGKCLKMDFRNDVNYQYRYTGDYHTGCVSSDKDDFILFLDEFFFSEKPEPVVEHKEEDYPYPPPTDIESALWGELFNYENWDGNKDTIYRVWRRVHHVLCLYANSDEAAFLKMIKSYTQGGSDESEKPEPIIEQRRKK